MSREVLKNGNGVSVQVKPARFTGTARVPTGPAMIRRRQLKFKAQAMNLAMNGAIGMLSSMSLQPRDDLSALSPDDDDRKEGDTEQSSVEGTGRAGAVASAAAAGESKDDSSGGAGASARVRASDAMGANVVNVAKFEESMTRMEDAIREYSAAKEKDSVEEEDPYAAEGTRCDIYVPWSSRAVANFFTNHFLWTRRDEAYLRALMNRMKLGEADVIGSPSFVFDKELGGDEGVCKMIESYLREATEAQASPKWCSPPAEVGETGSLPKDIESPPSKVEYERLLGELSGNGRKVATAMIKAAQKDIDDGPRSLTVAKCGEGLEVFRGLKELPPDCVYTAGKFLRVRDSSTH